MTVTPEHIAYLRRIREKEVDYDSPLYREFVSFLDSRPPYWAHYIRYCQTMRAFEPLLGGLPKGAVILEMGELCSVSLFLRHIGYDVRCTNSDLRYAIDAADDSVDLALSFEVLEHIGDHPFEGIDRHGLWVGSGARAHAGEVARVVRPGGMLVMSTPNPCSALALTRLVNGEAPSVFRPHVREYTRDEVVALFSGLGLVSATTHYSFYLLSGEAQKEAESVFERNGWDSSDRGDNHFMVFRKKN